jgi:Flp pilus assembly pilin Flp
MITRTVLRFVIDDAGQDLVEYALLSGIIGVAGVLLFPLIAGRMRAAYTGWQFGARAVWQPCSPGAGVCP